MFKSLALTALAAVTYAQLPVTSIIPDPDDADLILVQIDNNNVFSASSKLAVKVGDMIRLDNFVNVLVNEYHVQMLDPDLVPTSEVAAEDETSVTLETQFYDEDGTAIGQPFVETFVKETGGDLSDYFELGDNALVSDPIVIDAAYFDNSGFEGSIEINTDWEGNHSFESLSWKHYFGVAVEP